MCSAERQLDRGRGGLLVHDSLRPFDGHCGQRRPHLHVVSVPVGMPNSAPSNSHTGSTAAPS